MDRSRLAAALGECPLGQGDAVRVSDATEIYGQKHNGREATIDIVRPAATRPGQWIVRVHFTDDPDDPENWFWATDLEPWDETS